MAARLVAYSNILLEIYEGIKCLKGMSLAKDKTGAGNGQKIEETVSGASPSTGCLDLIRLRCWDAWCS